MSVYSFPPLGAGQQGGDDGVYIAAWQFVAALMRIPSPAGNVTARPAELHGQRHSR